MKSKNIIKTLLTFFTLVFIIFAPILLGSEIINGKRVFMKAKFAKFKDAEDGIKRNIAVLLGVRYKNARLNAKSPEEQILKIAESKYTTTPPKQYLKLMQGNIDRVRKKTGFGRIE
jgi:hypothetical protein